MPEFLTTNKKKQSETKVPSNLGGPWKPFKKSRQASFHPGALLSIPDLFLLDPRPRDSWLPKVRSWCHLPRPLSTLVCQAQVSPGPFQLLALCSRPGRWVRTRQELVNPLFTVWFPWWYVGAVSASRHRPRSAASTRRRDVRRLLPLCPYLAPPLRRRTGGGWEPDSRLASPPVPVTPRWRAPGSSVPRSLTPSPTLPRRQRAGALGTPREDVGDWWMSYEVS